MSVSPTCSATYCCSSSSKSSSSCADLLRGFGTSRLVATVPGHKAVEGVTVSFIWVFNRRVRLKNGGRNIHHVGLFPPRQLPHRLSWLRKATAPVVRGVRHSTAKLSSPSVRNKLAPRRMMKIILIRVAERPRLRSTGEPHEFRTVITTTRERPEAFRNPRSNG